MKSEKSGEKRKIDVNWLSITQNVLCSATNVQEIQK